MTLLVEVNLSEGAVKLQRHPVFSLFNNLNTVSNLILDLPYESGLLYITCYGVMNMKTTTFV